MNQLPNISDSELEIMKVLWERAPQTANEVIRALEGKTEWAPKTIRTLLTRLAQKGAVEIHQEPGKMYLYVPLVSQGSFVKKETKSFLQRLYGGALKPFLVNFLQEEKLSRDEIAELKRILEEQDDLSDGSK